jgi:hypothetical protein
MKVRKTLVGDAKAVSPNQPTVFLDAPSLGYLSPNHLLAVCRAAQHQPLERQQLRFGRKIDVCLSP